jgi:hypothetical protein
VTRKSKRGRPSKFGRPSQLVALTLPVDVLETLQTIHPDVAWAIVKVVEPLMKRTSAKDQHEEDAKLAELARLPGNRALIVVFEALVRNLPGVSAIPLADGRAFLAFDDDAGIASFELAILDRAEALPARSNERTSMEQLRDTVRVWRQDPELKFSSKAIILVEGAGSLASGHLPRLRDHD